MKHKTFDLVETKADGEKGEFTALASVFGNVDHVGDRMIKGAFSKTLEKWRATGDPIPIVLSHDWDDPMKFIGKADPRAVYETDKGLVVQGRIDVDSGNPVADQVYKLMKDRVLKGWSFGYTVPKGGQKRLKDGVNEVSEVDLFENGPTLKGANPVAELQAIKSALKGDEEHDVEEKDDLGDLSDEERQLVKDFRAGKAPEDVQIEERDEEPSEAKSPQDPLGKTPDELMFELVTQGIDTKPPPVVKEDPDLPSLEDLERQHDEVLFQIST